MGVVSMTISMIYFLYLTITRTALDIFNCNPTKPDTGSKNMAAQPLEECYPKDNPESLHWKLLPYAVAVLLVYCLGFPLTLLLMYWRGRKKIYADQEMRAH